jgi:diacylglycerol kinase family enzyme
VKILIVNNLKAGQGDAGLFGFVRALSAEGAEVTLRPTRGGAMAQAVDDAGSFDRVVAAGGDGTASAVAYALRNSGIPVLPYPAGTANLLALNLRIPTDPVKCAEVTLAGEHVEVDLGEISYGRTRRRGAPERRGTPRPPSPEQIGFAIVAGAGFDASIVEGANRLKDQIGASAYLVSAIRNIEPTQTRIRLVLDGEEHETEGSAVMVVNFAKIQFDLKLVSGGNPTDGLFELAVVKAKHVAELLPAVVAAFIDTIVDFPDRAGMVETYQASEIEVSMDPPLPLQADGETLSASSPFRAHVLPRAATFVVPPGTLSAGTGNLGR